MLTTKNLSAWVVERTCDWLLGGFLLLTVFGPGASDMDIAKEYKQDLIYVLYFFIGSGYLATTLWFGVAKRSQNVLRHSIVSVGLFGLHSSLFLVLSANDEHIVKAKIVVLGICVAAFSSIAGSVFTEALLNRSGKPQNSIA